MNQPARKSQLATALKTCRRRTLALLAAVPEAMLNLRVHDFYSPIGWHFGHIGMTEEYWVMTRALNQSPRNPDYSFLFANLPENPKDNRVHLPSREEIMGYLDATRKTTLNALQKADVDSCAPLLADGYAWEFAHQHECQHQETIIELLQLLAQSGGQSAANDFREEQATQCLYPPDSTHTTEMANIPGGEFLMGSDAPGGYDNEKQAHKVTVAPFQLAVRPVSVGQWNLFIQDGGYARPELWTPTGWQWRQAEGAEHPEYWQPQKRGYGCYRPGGLTGMSADEPVMSISWHEANAYARWDGKRLPTEAEWEFAARYDPRTGQTRPYPWGQSSVPAEGIDYGLKCAARMKLPAMQPRSLEMLASAPSTNPFGLRQMAGSVWEWTSTPFLPYPGFTAFPYDGYSKDHFDGSHYVCRGGSWASAEIILRASFRNWYIPTYRQGFLGLRCAV